MLRFCYLFLFLYSIPVSTIAAFSTFSVDIDPDNSVHLDVLAVNGTYTRLASLPFKVPFHGSVTASVEDSLVFVTNETYLMALDMATGATKMDILLPPGGLLKHIAYDYKHAADDAPGHNLYGLLETTDFNVSLVHIDKTSLEITLMTSMNVTGHVVLASFGLPKIEPQWSEPEMKHFGVVMKPAGAQPANGDIIAWIKVGSGGAVLGWSYLIDAKGKPLPVSSLSMNYDGGKEKPTKAHNVFIMIDSNQGGSDFGIVHMTGKIQIVYSHSNLVASRQSTKTSTVDMPNAKFYTVLINDNDQSFLVGFDCITGKQISSVLLSFTPRALYMNQAAITKV